MEKSTRDLIDEIQKLKPEEQEAVRKFVTFLKSREPSPFALAVDEFIEKHPELLRRLAK